MASARWLSSLRYPGGTGRMAGRGCRLMDTVHLAAYDSQLCSIVG